MEKRELLIEKRKELHKLEAEIAILLDDINEEDRQIRMRQKEDRQSRWDMDQFTARQAAYHRR